MSATDRLTFCTMEIGLYDYDRISLDGLVVQWQCACMSATSCHYIDLLPNGEGLYKCNQEIECGVTDGELPPKMLSTTYADTFQRSTHSKDNINQKYNNGPLKGHQIIIKRI